MKRQILLLTLFTLIFVAMPVYAQQEEGDPPSKPLVSFLAVLYFLMTTFLEVLEVIFFVFIWKELFQIKNTVQRRNV